VFKPNYNHSRCWSIDSHRKRGGRDDHAQSGITSPEMLFDDPPLFSIKMRVVEGNAMRKNLAQVG
jgi:hypothetical protein